MPDVHIDWESGPLSVLPIGPVIRYTNHLTEHGGRHDTDRDCAACREFVAVLFRHDLIGVNPVTLDLELRFEVLTEPQPGQDDVDLATVLERRGTPAQPAGDVLSMVDPDGQLLCGCGCGRGITDQSPSAYYATPACQKRWMKQQARNPEEVTGNSVDAVALLSAEIFEARRQFAEQLVTGPRPGAAVDGPDQGPGVPADAPVVAWLQQIPDHVADRAQIDVGPETGRVRVAIPPAEPVGVQNRFEYQRHCVACRGWASPWTVCGPVDVDVLVALPPANGERSVRQECALCRAKLPGRVYFGTVYLLQDPYGDVQLQLEDGHFKTSRTLNQADHSQLTAGQDAVRSIWQRMEGQLDQFAADWRPTSESSQPIPAGLPYLLDVPPPPYRRGRRT